MDKWLRILSTGSRALDEDSPERGPATVGARRRATWMIAEAIIQEKDKTGIEGSYITASGVVRVRCAAGREWTPPEVKHCQLRVLVLDCYGNSLGEIEDLHAWAKKMGGRSRPCGYTWTRRRQFLSPSGRVGSVSGRPGFNFSRWYTRSNAVTE